ncbi:MAG TPA: alpha/beta fold hydrolase [Gaiellaceae bacterium]|nr:alpha/beta fold hydrolase [Gaiellaceae bacterium]
MRTRPRLLLVHGSVVNGETTWAAQRPLADRHELVVCNRRGFPPGPPVEQVDYADEAVWLDAFLEPGAHLVAHSYGGVIALLAAARRPELVRSLTVVEPPAFRIARGHPEVDRLVTEGDRLWEEGPRDPEAFLRTFLRWVGAPEPPGRFSPALLQGARLLQHERRPWTAEIPLGALAAAPFPILAVSGGHAAAFEAVCDVLADRAGAERAVLPGAGHSVQRLAAPFNDLLAEFVARAES